jgi:hypothetical protein
MKIASTAGVLQRSTTYVELTQLDYQQIGPASRVCPAVLSRGSRRSWAAWTLGAWQDSQDPTPPTPRHQTVSGRRQRSCR